MSKEGNHHYLSQFHLDEWAGGSGKVIRWRRIEHQHKLAQKLVSTAATAYRPGLYSIQSSLPENTQIIEKKIFGQIENEAAPILRKLIAEGPDSLSGRERIRWAVYLNASYLRVPHIVDKFKLQTDAHIREKLSRQLDEYDSQKADSPEGSLFEWAMNNRPNRIMNSGMRVLVTMICDERVLQRLSELIWHVADISKASRSLLIGDNPFQRVGGLYHPSVLISLPLSPKHLFLATHDQQMAALVGNKPDRDIVRASNISTLTTAKQFAYGDAETAFVDKYFLH
ncbi:MAG: hypothetical protein COA62_10905 [Rhodobiaceae bacterium]|nr:MAG: hypothetical protein COA62_10905 [Rhodobiaceae bacterium]